jgi:iron-sulfur cluster repair protein YtfE (RIC family)
MKKKQINKDIEIEDLVRDFPESVAFLRNNGIRCLQCGEPIWGTLESAALEKGLNSKEIENLTQKLIILLDQKT